MRQSRGAYLIGERVDRDTEGTSQPEISKLQLPLPVDEQVLRLEVSVQHPVLVAERGTLEKLVHKTPDGDWVQCAALAMNIHVLLEIALAVLEDEDKLSLSVDNVVKSNDVDVFELLHEGDFPDGGGRGTFPASR